MWIIFAVLNPFSDSVRNLFSKKASFSGINPLLISWVNNIIPLIAFFPLIFFTHITLNKDYLIALFISGSINIIAVILYMRAIAEGDISEVVPMLSFTPLFLLITSPILVGEFPHFWGLVGIILIVFGSYILNVRLKTRQFLAPIKALVKNKGTRYMLIVAIIWSISANYDKIAINHSSVMQHIFFINLFIFTGTTLIVLFTRSINFQQIKIEKKNLFFVSLFTMGTFIFHYVALSLTLVAYVVTLKRMSGMISVFLGHFFLHEPNIRERLTGAAIMFVGVMLIILS